MEYETIEDLKQDPKKYAAHELGMWCPELLGSSLEKLHKAEHWHMRERQQTLYFGLGWEAFWLIVIITGELLYKDGPWVMLPAVLMFIMFPALAYGSYTSTRLKAIRRMIPVLENS